MSYPSPGSLLHRDDHIYPQLPETLAVDLSHHHPHHGGSLPVSAMASSSMVTVGFSASSGWATASCHDISTLPDSLGSTLDGRSSARGSGNAPKKHHTGRQQTQSPGFDRVREDTETEDPTTQTQRVPLFQQNKSPRVDVRRGPLNSHVSLHIANMPHSPTRATIQQYQSMPTPSKHLANTPVRRSYRPSTSSASSPKPGLRGALRSTLDLDGLGERQGSPGGALYPQLPNVSRTLSPPISNPTHWQVDGQGVSGHGPRRVTPTVEVDSAAPDLQRHGRLGAHASLRPSSDSSGSWSGDSGYLVEEPARTPVRSGESKVHIAHWLSTLQQRHITEEDCSTEPAQDEDSADDVSDPGSPLSSNVCSERGSRLSDARKRVRNGPLLAATAAKGLRMDKMTATTPQTYLDPWTGVKSVEKKTRGRRTMSTKLRRNETAGLPRLRGAGPGRE